MNRRTRIGLALGVVLLVAAIAVGGVFEAESFVRGRVHDRAVRAGAEVDVGVVRLGFGHVSLRGVHVRFPAAPAVEVFLDEVAVDLTLRGATKQVEARGGCIFATGALASIRDQALAARANMRGDGPQATGGQRKVSVHDVCVRWRKDAASPPIAALDGAFLELQEAGTALGARSFEAIEERRSLKGAEARVELVRAGGVSRIARATVRELRIEQAADEAERTRREAAEEAAAPERSLASRARDLDRAVRFAQARFVEETTTDALVEIAALEAVVGEGESGLHIGPARLSVARTGDGARAELSSRDEGKAAVLGFSFDVPSAEGEPLRLRVTGGPVSLHALGLRDGDLGLANVGAATVEASGAIGIGQAGQRVTFDGSGRARNVSVQRPSVSSSVVRGADAAFAAKGELALDGSAASIEHAQIELGKVRAEVEGQFDRSADGRLRARGTWVVPMSSCQGLLDALPEGFAPKLAGIKMSGAFSLQGGVQFDAERPDGDAVDFKLLDECRVITVPAEIDVARFRRQFSRTVYAPDGAQVQIVSGPGTPEWVPLNAISPFMTAAVLTTEDGGFRHHRGFDIGAIRNSIRDDVRTGRFLRGASTISMQTAKNLYLAREKTLSRKLQEAVLTHYLEQALTKEEILELYFNSIEFGPMIYGIGPAAHYYFNTTATDLSLGQSLYLSSILPNPKAQHFEPDGRVSVRWMSYLRTLMRLSAKRRLIEEGELREGLSEWVTFGVARPPRVNAVDDGLPVEHGTTPNLVGP